MSSNTNVIIVPVTPVEQPEEKPQKVPLRRGPETYPTIDNSVHDSVKRAFRDIYQKVYQLHAAVEQKPPPKAQAFVASVPKQTATPACVGPELVLVSSTPTGMTNSISSVWAQGDYVYVVGNTGADFTLKIWYVRDPTAPLQVGELGLTPSSSVPPLVTLLTGQGHYLYMTSGIGAAAFLIVDVIDPQNPVITFSGNVGGFTNSCYVQGQYAYITGGLGGGTALLTIYDISNPAAPVLKSSTAIGTLNQLFGVKAVGDYLYVTGIINIPASGSMLIYDITNPASPSLQSTTALTDAFSFDLWVDGRYAYLAGDLDTQIGSALIIYDVSDVTAPTQTGEVKVTDPNSNPCAAGIDGQGNHVYTGGGFAPLWQFDVTDRSNPVLLNVGVEANGSTADSGAITFIPSIQARYVWISAQTQSQSNTPVLNGYLVGGFFCEEMETAGIYVWDKMTAQEVRGRRGEFSGQVVAQSVTTAKGGGITCSGDLQVLDGQLFINGLTLDEYIDRRTQWKLYSCLKTMMTFRSLKRLLSIFRLK